MENADLINERDIGIYNKKEVCLLGKQTYVCKNVGVDRTIRNSKLCDLNNLNKITSLIKLPIKHENRLS